MNFGVQKVAVEFEVVLTLIRTSLAINDEKHGGWKTIHQGTVGCTPNRVPICTHGIYCVL